ncbi:MAG: class I SAM-dependent RNA methyltransferase [Kineosporiaceae bacterium]|nr:class I SAM-dependent RNA methyltransferase [Kineosporiaceae bacterium]
MSEPLLRLEVGPVAAEGCCVARHEGRVVFVRHALPGEVVLARLDEASRGPEAAGRRFWRAEAVEVLEPSPDRVQPSCAVAGAGGCGGCDWQHASMAAQRRGKAEVVREQFRRLAGMELPELVVEAPGRAGPGGVGCGVDGGGDGGGDGDGDGGGDDGLGWRTRVRFAVDAEGRPGLRAARSHRVIPVTSCPIAHPAVLATGVLDRRWPGVETIDVATGSQGPAITVPEPAPVRHRGPAPRTWVRHRVLMPGPQPRVERSFRVSRGGFWQVHPQAGQLLVDAVADAVRPLPGERAVDLYAGAGLFTAALALGVGATGVVIAVEGDDRACADARRNLHDLPQVRLEQVHIDPRPGQARGRGQARARGAGRSGRRAPGPAGGPRSGGPDAAGLLAVLGSRADVVVLDPPRAGAGPVVIDRLIGLRPRVIAYLACDPASLARDVAHAARRGFRLDTLRVFDLFPMTHHVECLATLRPSDESPGRPGVDLGTAGS